MMPIRTLMWYHTKFQHVIRKINDLEFMGTLTQVTFSNRFDDARDGTENSKHDAHFDETFVWI